MRTTPAYQRPDLTGTSLSYRDSEVTSHGPDHEYVYPGRQVVEIPGHTWPTARPRTAPTPASPATGSPTAAWSAGGCSLDST